MSGASPTAGARSGVNDSGPQKNVRTPMSASDGIRFIAIGGLVGTHSASAWTELGGPWPAPVTA